jgi:hypothetical protein
VTNDRRRFIPGSFTSCRAADAAIENGAHLIIINRSNTYLDVRADVVFSDDVAEVILTIVTEVLGD